jgi:Bacterial lectin
MNSHKVGLRKISILIVLVVLGSGVLSPSLFAQGAFSITSFTSSNLCPTPYTATGCVVAINDNAVASGGGALQLTASVGNQVGSAWAVAPETVLNGFTTQFQFQFTNPSNPPADGIAFVIQNVPTNPLGAIGFTGGNGGAIGYGGDDANNDVAAGITNSLAIEFDSYQNGWDPDPDHVAVQTCGTGYNTSHHGQNCPNTSTTSTLGITAAGALKALGITITDGNVHTVNIIYNPLGTACFTQNSGNLCIYLDPPATSPTPVLQVTADLSTIGLTNGMAYVGFTGATGGSYETQDILSWTFTPATANTTMTLTPGAPVVSVINSNPAALIEQTIQLPTSGLSCNGQPGNTCPETPLTLMTSNVLIPNLGSYVVGTPFATGQCFGRLGNPNGSCSLYENACYGGSITLAQADDYYCPSVTQGQPPSTVINLLDTWVPATQPDPSKTLGTTISLIAFSPSFPGETWMPAPAGQTTPNAVCTDPFGTSTSAPPPPVGMVGGSGCDFVDSLVNISGDQTTTKGSKPKSKAWLMSTYGVYYPPSSVYLNGSNTPVNTPGTYNPSATSGTWYQAAPSLTFTANPACPYFNTYPCNLSAADQVTYNYFAPAPVAGESYDVITLANQPPANQAPSAYVIPPTSATPPASFNTESAVPVTFTGSLAGLPQPPDGQYLLEFGASDNVGIGERYIYLTPPMNGYCPTPNGPLASTGSCYVTTPFQVQLNIDSTKPTIVSAALSPAGSPAGTFYAGQSFQVLSSCIDNLTNGVASGLASCGGQSFSCPLTQQNVTSPTITAPTIAGNYSYTVTAKDCAGNITTMAVPYTVAPSVTLQLNTIPLINFTTTLPGGLLTFGAAITNQSAATADDVTVTTTFANTSGVSLGTASATISTVTCSNSPCTLKGVVVSTTKCNVAGTTNQPLISCTVPSLGPVSTKTGLWMEIILPVSSKSPAGTFTSVTTAGSAGITTANSIKESYTVVK